MRRENSGDWIIVCEVETEEEAHTACTLVWSTDTLCHKRANSTCWDTEPVDTKSINAVCKSSCSTSTTREAAVCCESSFSEE